LFPIGQPVPITGELNHARSNCVTSLGSLLESLTFKQGTNYANSESITWTHCIVSDQLTAPLLAMSELEMLVSM
jgi:hypothetical protein